MPSPYVTSPIVYLPNYRVSTDEICDDIQANHPAHTRLGAALRVVRNTGVQNRWFTRPLASPLISGTAPLDERTTAAFSDALSMAEQAAQQVLNANGLAPADIDAVITSHTTSWGVPNLDVQLLERIGLRPDVRRLSMTTMACAGGVQSLIRASDFVAARPRSKVLVVAAEVISSVYNHTDDSIESMIYKGLFGDSAGACVVSDTPLGAGMRIDDTWEYLLPGSTAHYSGRLDAAGLHFDSTRAALTGADDVLPHLLNWMGTWRPDFPIIHPGGPGIIAGVTKGIGLDDKAAHHSWASLAENGNLGGVAVFDVLARTHTDPPKDGDEGLLLTFGPGFTSAAIRGTWCA
ncbi:PhlD [Streptomyces blastmyceticus]|uniref:Type III polyketide synthase n=1 Tax=Streptomyces blastmyceticus TaxID=68180 RepID=A0ABP3GMN2_9ACTN